MSELDDLGTTRRSTRITRIHDELGGETIRPNLVRAETPEERRRGLTRRELLVKAPWCGGALDAGSFAGGRPKLGEGSLHGHAERDQPRRRMATGAQAQAEKDLVSSSTCSS